MNDIHLGLIFVVLVFVCMNLCVEVFPLVKIMKKRWMFIFLLLMSKHIFIIFFLFFIYSQLTFPNFVKDHDFKNLMQLMLSKNQAQRFYKLEQIQSHIWFKDFSWDDLISLNMKPAYIPKIDINENKCEPKPYLDYIKSLKDWEPDNEQKKITKKNIAEFEEWFKNF